MDNRRKIVIDIEMTSLDLAGGARIVEIGAVELIESKPTGEKFHTYINPEGQLLSASAAALTGLTDEFLAKQPPFAEIAVALSDFIGDSQIVIYCGIKKNSSADQNFLNHEMERAGMPPFPREQWINMRYWAGTVFSGAGKNSLNDVLDKYAIDRSGRNENDGHGGMVDAELTAQLYPHLRADWRKAIENNKKTAAARGRSRKGRGRGAGGPGGGRSGGGRGAGASGGAGTGGGGGGGKM